MLRYSIFAVLGVTCAILSAQAPTPRDPMGDLGFTYNVPQDWTVVETAPSPEAVKTQPTQAPAALEQKRGSACIQVAETARHGDPSSVIVVVTLPFDCFGQTMTAQDLPGFGSSAAEGLKQVFDISDPVYGAYSLGSHSLWIERAKGNPKGKTEKQYTMEIACSLLQKGAVCWMTMAADEASLRAFEQGTVTLDGEAAAPLIPATAFDKAPS
jgi:hypothetical protein